MLDTDRSAQVAHTIRGDFDPGVVDSRSDNELEDEIAELCIHIDAATYRLLRAMAEFDRREAWGWGFQSTAHWLSWRVGIDLVTAREKVRGARALEGPAPDQRDLPAGQAEILQGEGHDPDCHLGERGLLALHRGEGNGQ